MQRSRVIHTTVDVGPWQVGGGDCRSEGGGGVGAMIAGATWMSEASW